ncbi:helix-turn-helix domain-containing protein [Gilvimarinus polysaccharolyticus]|uniref:helix-turn-helix domain-containing protein n=1 Tax=Gilvimarinus polysaccharolyticus TaxID=863921 RepID=UPI0006732A42|nr:helix-turn-helix transcriptional regulator [Gilvimarinus polysaccharolyticus]
MSAKELFYPPNKQFSKAEDKAYAREELIYNVTEDLLVILEDHAISKAELAKKLGKSKSFVTQLLSGSRNMTLGTLSDICFALGFAPKVLLPIAEAPLAEARNFEWKAVTPKAKATAPSRTKLTERKIIGCSHLPQWHAA